MSVNCHGVRSVPRRIHGGGPQGAKLGILECLSQTNKSSDCVPEGDRFKFIDDLSILEIINLLTVGISSFNLKFQVPNDIPDHNQYITAVSLKSQEWLDSIEKWTTNQKMLINQKNTKSMIFN